VRSLKVLANKRTVVSTRSVPAQVRLAGTRARAYKVTLLAKVKSGKGQRTLRAGRAAVICSKR